MVKKLFVSIFLLYAFGAYAKSTFYEKDILLFCTQENPFFATIVLKKEIVKARELFYKGAFDTQLNGIYENKEYPLSNASFEKVAFMQPLHNGVELSLFYRKAQGTQEYNNIKTGKDGELQATLLVPLNNLLYNTGERDVNYEIAKLQTKKSKKEIQRLLQGFYKDLAGLYYTLLYQKASLINEENLLKKSQQRLNFLGKEVAAGKKASIELIQNRHLILQRKQRVLDAQSKFLQIKNSFITYLGMSDEYFNKHYTLPKLSIMSYSYKVDSYYIDKAYHIRADIEGLVYQRKSLQQQQRLNSLSKYPKIDLKANTLYDLAYKQDGYKLSAELTFTLQRNSYKSEYEKLQKKLLLINSKQGKLKAEISLNISNVLQNIYFLKKKKELYEEEIELSKILEIAEKKRYKEGVSNLIFVNQREIDALHAKQKLLENQLQREKIKLQLQYETGAITLQTKRR